MKAYYQAEHAAENRPGFWRVLKRRFSRAPAAVAGIVLALALLLGSLPVLPLLTVSSAGEIPSQTKYSDVNAYQDARIQEIQKDIFFAGKTPEEYTEGSPERKALSALQNGPLKNDTHQKDGSLGEGQEAWLRHVPVSPQSRYFSWHTDSALPKWDGVQNFPCLNQPDGPKDTEDDLDVLNSIEFDDVFGGAKHLGDLPTVTMTGGGRMNAFMYLMWIPQGGFALRWNLPPNLKTI